VCIEVGAQVKAVRGRQCDMQPEPMFVGRVGTVVSERTDRSGVYYEVEFQNGTDFIDAKCLEVQR